MHIHLQSPALCHNVCKANYLSNNKQHDQMSKYEVIWIILVTFFYILLFLCNITH